MDYKRVQQQQQEKKAKGADSFAKIQRDHPYITSAKGLSGWVQKMAIFADLQHWIYADIVFGWVDGWV